MPLQPAWLNVKPFIMFASSKMGPKALTAWKVSKCRVFSAPYFPVFGLNTETYSVNRRIQFEYRKMRTKKNSVFGYFSRSVHIKNWKKKKGQLQVLQSVCQWVLHIKHYLVTFTEEILNDKFHIFCAVILVERGVRTIFFYKTTLPAEFIWSPFNWQR